MPDISTLGVPIKAAYEGQPDTNDYSDAEKAKLASIAAGAQVNTINSTVTGITGAVLIPNIVQISQANYDALDPTVKNANTFIIVA